MNPANLVESHISHGELLRLIPDETMVGQFRKRQISPKNIDTIHKHLVDQNESHISADEKPTTPKDKKIDVPPNKAAVVRDMPWKHERIWFGQLGQIKATAFRIDSKFDVNPFKSPPYRAVPKTREHEQPEINKHLNFGVIKSAISE